MFINLSSIVGFFENWHALLHEQYFWKHRFLAICRCAFKCSGRTYSRSDNETAPISEVATGQYFTFHSLTSPPCCNSTRKCTPVKYKKRQQAGFPEWSIIEFSYLEYTVVHKSNRAIKEMHTLDITPAHLDFS